METRIALIGIAVETSEPIEKLNAILHEYAGYIVGRMGVPYHKRNISFISIVIDAKDEVIRALSDELSALPHVNVNRLYSDIPSAKE